MNTPPPPPQLSRLGTVLNNIWRNGIKVFPHNFYNVLSNETNEIFVAISVYWRSGNSCSFNFSLMFLLRDISIHYELKFMAMVSTSQLFVLDQSNQLSWRIQFLRNSARHVELFNKHSHSEIYLLGCTFGVGTSWKSCFIAYSQNGNTYTLPLV